MCGSEVSCLTICSPMDCSPPGTSVYGVLQERILEWVAIPFSKSCGDTDGNREQGQLLGLKGHERTLEGAEGKRP